MSKASVSRTIKFIAKAGTYTAVIMCPDGDIYQEWEGTQAEHSVSPNFSKTTPILYFVCMSSRVTEGITTPDGMTYYFNGTKIEFSGNTSSGTYAGYFKKVSPSENQPYYGLQILKNIADLAGLANATIKMVANVSYLTQSDQIQAEYTIPIQKATGSSYRVTITAGDNKSFVITEKGGSCILKAKAYQSGTELTKELTYQWEKMGASGWDVLTGQTSQTLTVSGNDIDTYGEYRVTVYRAGAEIGKDIQGVMDASDPYEIDVNPTPKDETIVEDATENDTHYNLVYEPHVVKRGSTVVAVPNASFYFVVKDAAGTYLNSETSRTTAATKFTVTHAMAMQASGDFSITITVKD